ncbi:GATA transcription factor 27-like [Typha latifolia]|uniref:GATA transcription factor 27-like n=1 Tax=Typha latifolia TaxID=4733 RepID=UPI003C30B16E
MGKHGPCRHCGVTSTPLWRNGPPEKPVLCNACGSRWRTKGSLTNYTPIHAREAIDSEEINVTKVKSISFKPKEQKLPKKKQNNAILENEREMPFCDQNFRKIVEGDTSNRSSSGSAISYSESCGHFGTADASDLTGSAQSNVWDSLVPSKKRTCIAHPKPSHVEKLTQDLYSIMHEQQSSYLSGSSNDDLLYQSETPAGSFETGYGSYLIRHSSSKLLEEESEASSIPLDHQSSFSNEAYSGSAPFPVHSERKGTRLSNINTEKFKKCPAQVAQDNSKRDKHHEKIQILQNAGSPLKLLDLADVINFGNFINYLTREEQEELLKYLPPTDTKPPESLRSMFSTSQYLEALHCYQKLLREGVFDLSFSEANTEECRALKSLVLLDPLKSKWVECYKQLEGKNYKKTGGKEMFNRPNLLANSKLASLKRPHDSRSCTDTELKGTMRSPKKVCKSRSNMDPPLESSDQPKSSNAATRFVVDTDDFVDNDGACFNPRNFLASSPDRRSMLVQYTDDSSDHNLLVDVPCNGSFPEAELLYHPPKEKSATNNSPAESGVAEM